MSVKPSEFGLNHWTVFQLAYETHPQKLTLTTEGLRINSYSRPLTHHTTLKGGRRLANYDDLDCLQDLMRAGLIKEKEISRNTCVYALTRLGGEVGENLKEHVIEHGSYLGFVIPDVRLIKRFHKTVEKTLNDLGPS